MIIYLSNGTDPVLFESYQKKGYIAGLLQAQKFNATVIQGLSYWADVLSVTNLSYKTNVGEIKSTETNSEHIRYFCIGNKPGKLHKLRNIIEMLHVMNSKAKNEKVNFVICDAINPLAALSALFFSRMKRIKAVAIITDIPQFLSGYGRFSFSRLTEELMKCFDGYVYLTKYMDALVNVKKKPYMVMEAICTSVLADATACHSKEKVVLYSGSVSMANGLDTLVRGFERADIVDWQLHIYGAGDADVVVAQAQARSSRIKYFGSVPNSEVVAAQQRASILINPRPMANEYNKYAFPSKLMEYMSSGTAVMSTKLAGIPDEYDDYLYLIEDDSADGIAAALKRVTSFTEDERAKKAKAAQNFMRKNKSANIQAKRIIEFAEGLGK